MNIKYDELKTVSTQIIKKGKAIFFIWCGNDDTFNKHLYISGLLSFVQTLL